MAPEEPGDGPSRQDGAVAEERIETDPDTDGTAVDEPNASATADPNAESSDDATADAAGLGVVDQTDDLDVAGGRVVVVGYDAWTEPVVEELLALDCRVTVIVTDDAAATTLRDRGLEVVRTDDIDEACFHAAGLEDADAVFVPTLDEQQNVLAVLTVMNTDQSVHIATFASEAADVPKLRAAGADTVVSLGAVVGELLVEVGLTDRSVDEVVEELTGRV